MRMLLKPQIKERERERDASPPGSPPRTGGRAPKCPLAPPLPKSAPSDAARRRLRELLDKYGLAGTDFVNQLHRELYTADFLSEEAKLDMTEWMAGVDYRLVEGGGEQIQLAALTARLVTHLRT